MFSKHKISRKHFERTLGTLLLAWVFAWTGLPANGQGANLADNSSTAVAASAGSNETSEDDAKETTIQRSEHQLVQRTSTLNNKTKLYEIEITYPQFTSGTSKQKLDELNRRIRTDVMKIANMWKSGVPNQPPIDGLVMSLSGGAETSLATPEFVSIQVTLQSCTGGPHPNNFGVPLNYRLSPLRTIKINDVFPTSDALKTLSKLSRQALYDMEISTKDVINEGTKPLAKNFDNFVFDTRQLQIIFQEYQVGPYLAGMPTAVLRYDDQLKHLASTSPIIQQIRRRAKASQH